MSLTENRESGKFIAAREETEKQVIEWSASQNSANGHKGVTNR